MGARETVLVQSPLPWPSCGKSDHWVHPARVLDSLGGNWASHPITLRALPTETSGCYEKYTLWHLLQLYSKTTFPNLLLALTRPSSLPCQYFVLTRTVTVCWWLLQKQLHCKYSVQHNQQCGQEKLRRRQKRIGMKKKQIGLTNKKRIGMKTKPRQIGSQFRWEAETDGNLASWGNQENLRRGSNQICTKCNTDCSCPGNRPGFCTLHMLPKTLHLSSLSFQSWPCIPSFSFLPVANLGSTRVSLALGVLP